MTIDWNIVATIAAPLIALLVGAALNRAIEGRSRLISYLGHASAHHIELEDGTPLDIHTHSIVLKNAGRRPARNVRLTHAVLPNFNVYPGVDFNIEKLPSGDIDIVLPVLVSQQEITISYLYHPPITWKDVNGLIKSDEGFAKVVSVLPTIQYPAWVNTIATGLTLIGLIASLYVLYVILNRVFA